MPLALLPNRESETVTQWLKTYPHIEVVSLDGFTGFLQAISDANSSILQVYDRWHFIRNAKKQLEKILPLLFLLLLLGLPSFLSNQQKK